MTTEQQSSERRVRIGFVGIGMGASMILYQLDDLPQFEMAAGADVNPRVREAFHDRYPDARVYDDADKLFADPDVEAVWIATPNQFHAPMAVAAARQGKHVVIEKPMALSIEDGLRMIEAAEDNHVSLLCGHTLGFSPQVRAMRRVIKSGRLGAVRAVNTWAYTDWMVAPRMPDEVDFAQGGGLIYRQVPHQADTVRLLGDGVAQTVRGTTGQWADWRSETPGYYSAYLEFDNGATANIVYNGYGHFMTQDMVPWSVDRGISGADVVGRGAIRRGLRDGSREEHDLKDASRLGGSNSSNRFARRGPSGPPEWVPNHLGILVVSCEGGDIRHSRYGISVYSDDGMQDIAVEEHYRPGREDLIELYDAIVHDKPVFHDGRWGLATLEIALGIIQSSDERREVQLNHQVRMADAYDAAPA